MAVTEKTSSQSGAGPTVTPSSRSSLANHSPTAIHPVTGGDECKYKTVSVGGQCPLSGLGRNDSLQSARRAPSYRVIEKEEEDEEQDSFPHFIRNKTEEYSKRIRKLQDDYLYPLKEDLAEWINRVLQTTDLTAENFIQRLDNGVLILRLAKIIESQCDMFHTESATVVRRKDSLTTNGSMRSNHPDAQTVSTK